MAISDADWEAWSEMQRDGAPDVTRLSDRTHTARKEHTLGCGCIVKPGEKYGVAVDLVDGKMETYKGHALGWVSCPKNYTAPADRCPDCEGAGSPECATCDGTGEAKRPKQMER